MCHPSQLTNTHSSRKQSSWRGTVTGSTLQSPSTPWPSPPRSKHTSALQPRVSPRQQTGPSPHQPPASTSRRPQRHPPGRANVAAEGRRLRARRAVESRWSRNGSSTRTLIQRTGLTTACPKMSRPKLIKPLQQQQHRVRLILVYCDVLDEHLNQPFMVSKHIYY